MASKPDLQRHSQDLGNATLSWLEAGAPEQGTILFLHGIPASAELWRDIAERMAAAGYRVLVPDLAGYGETRLPPDGDYSLRGSASLIANWMDRVSEEPVHLVMHDLGGCVGQMLLVDVPGRWASASICNSPIGDSWPVRPIRMLRLMARLGLYVPLAALKLIVNPYTSWELRHAVAQQTHLTAAVRQRIFWDSKLHDAEGRRQFARHLRALDPRQTIEIEDRLPDYSGPVQLIWGMRDHFLGWEQVGERFVRSFPGARVTQLNQSGHFLQLDEPEEVIQALLGFAGSQ